MSGFGCTFAGHNRPHAYALFVSFMSTEFCAVSVFFRASHGDVAPLVWLNTSRRRLCSVFPFIVARWHDWDVGLPGCLLGRSCCLWEDFRSAVPVGQD